MIIKKLYLHNFGVYAGDNEFVFDGQKPIVLIGGMNGRGKTTFLEAVLLALYGKSSVAYSENEKKSYSQYLKSFVNRESEDKTCSIRIEFEISNTNRELSRLCKRTVKRKALQKPFWMFRPGLFPCAFAEAGLFCCPGQITKWRTATYENG